MLNKKGGIGEFIPNILGYVFLFFITIMFYIIATHLRDEVEENIGLEISTDNSKTMFLLFLREPIYYEGTQMPISQLIIEAQYDNEKRKEVRKLIESNFDYRYGDFWDVGITYPDEYKLFYGHSYTFQRGVVWIKYLQRLSLRFVNFVPVSIILPVDESIIVLTNLPSHGEGTINVELKTWILIG